MVHDLAIFQASALETHLAYHKNTIGGIYSKILRKL